VSTFKAEHAYKRHFPSLFGTDLFLLSILVEPVRGCHNDQPSPAVVDDWNLQGSRQM